MIFIGIILSEKGTDTSKYLLAATLSNFLIILGYTLEMMGRSEQFAMVSVKVQLIGLFFLITIIVFFVARCANITIPKVPRFIMLALDMLLVAAAVTAEYHSLYFSDYYVETNGLNIIFICAFYDGESGAYGI